MDALPRRFAENEVRKQIEALSQRVRITRRCYVESPDLFQLDHHKAHHRPNQVPPPETRSESRRLQAEINLAAHFFPTGGLTQSCGASK
jgi:hypothetical protein